MAYKPQHEFVDLLKKHAVVFCLVGGHAVQVHGYGRETEDIDIVWLRNDDMEARLLTCLQQANACWITNEKDPATGIERLKPVDDLYIGLEHLMMLCTDYGFVDLFDYIPGFPTENVEGLFATALEVGGVRYASLEWLKKMKQAAGRPKDLLDLSKLP